MKPILPLLAAAAIALSGCDLPDLEDTKPLDTGTGAATAKAASTSLPDPSDFDIEVLVIERSCFGSYGCNVRYQINPVYTGAGELPDKRFTVVYQVSGCKDTKESSFKASASGWDSGVLDWDFCTSPDGELSAQATSVIP